MSGQTDPGRNTQPSLPELPEALAGIFAHLIRPGSAYMAWLRFRKKVYTPLSKDVHLRQPYTHSSQSENHVIWRAWCNLAVVSRSFSAAARAFRKREQKSQRDLEREQLGESSSNEDSDDE